jgi:hypothetical protein
VDGNFLKFGDVMQESGFCSDRMGHPGGQESELVWQANCTYLMYMSMYPRYLGRAGVSTLAAARVLNTATPGGWSSKPRQPKMQHVELQ